MKAVKTQVRDLHASHPDDYAVGTHDVIVLCDDGKVRYSEHLFDSKADAEEHVEYLELTGFEGLDGWDVTQYFPNF